jgi:hypothetical protein
MPQSRGTRVRYTRLAARQGVPWVRRHARVPQVAAYNQARDFALVREEQRTHCGCTCWRVRPSGCWPASVT